MYDSADPSTWGDYVNPDDVPAGDNPGTGDSGSFLAGVGDSLGKALTQFGTAAANAYALNLTDRIRGKPTNVSGPQALAAHPGSQTLPAGSYFAGTSGGIAGVPVGWLVGGAFALIGVVLIVKLAK